MKIIEPKVELFDEGLADGVGHDAQVSHVARCARVCYASMPAPGSKSQRHAADVQLVEALSKRGHTSMYRHESRYYIFPTAHIPHAALSYLLHSPYVAHTAYRKTTMMSTNGQFLLDHPRLACLLQPYEVSASGLLAKMEELPDSSARQVARLIRHTFCVTTQVSTSRELNRMSPNNIAEQSTRYVNFGRRGGITICRPHWWSTAPWYRRAVALVSWQMAEWAYMLMLRMGMKPEDARGVLPLDTATRVVYTYNGREWYHFLQLRLEGTTGRAHPNARLVAAAIHLGLTRSHASSEQS